MIKTLLLCVVATCNVVFALAQNTTIKGIVRDDATHEPLAGVNVILKNVQTNAIITFSTTSADGRFEMQSPPSLTDNDVLQISCLGYEQKQLNVAEDGLHNIYLKEKPFQLREVSVKTDKIIQSNDTTSYFVASFATEKDRSIGDVLANMPGINIAENGNISYNGNPIGKFYIEGIDLFEGKYKIATDNISHDNISRVEVIENHQSIKALRGTGMDTETAINLKLKDGAKSCWNGHLTGKSGAEPDGGLWEAEAFAARFSKESQTASGAKTNNTGKNIADEHNTLTIDDLLYFYPDSKVSGNLKNEPSISTDLDEDRTRINRSYTLNNSNMWKSGDDCQLKTQLIFADDKKLYNQSIETAYYLTDSVLTSATAENSDVRDRNLQLSGTATIDKENYFLHNKISFSSNWRSFNSTIEGDFGNTSTADIDEHKIENRLKFVSKAKGNIFQIMSVNNFTVIPENLVVAGETTKRQSVDKSNFFSNTSLKFTRGIKKWTIGTDFDLTADIYDLQSEYSDTENNYDNDISEDYFGATLAPEIVYQNNKIRFKTRIPVAAYHFAGVSPADKLFCKPEIHFKWKLMPRWSLSLNAAAGTAHSGNSRYYTAPIMTDYKQMYVGTICHDATKEILAAGRIAYANPSEMLFINMGATHSYEKMNHSIKKNFNTDCIIYSYTSGSDWHKLTFADASVSKGLGFMNGTAEWRGTLQNTNMPIEQNGDTFTFDFGNLTSDISLKSSVTDWLDADYEIGYVYNYLKSSAMRSSIWRTAQKCRLTFYLTDYLDVKIQGEHYSTHFDGGEKKNTFFADAFLTYKYKQFDIFASVTNCFNSRTYSYTTYEDLSSTHTRYDIRGVNVLVGLSWYF